MGWAIMFLVLIALVIILSISLINWKIQIYKVIVQLNAILNRKTKKESDIRSDRQFGEKRFLFLRCGRPLCIGAVAGGEDF